MYSSCCESLPVINMCTWKSPKAGLGKGSHSHLEAESSEPVKITSCYVWWDFYPAPFTTNQRSA